MGLPPHRGWQLLVYICPLGMVSCTVFVCRPASDSLFEVTLAGALLEFDACVACIAAFLSLLVIPSFEVTRAVGGRSPRSWIGPVDPLFFHGCLVAQVDHLVPSSLRSRGVRRPVRLWRSELLIELIFFARLAPLMHALQNI